MRARVCVCMYGCVWPSAGVTNSSISPAANETEVIPPLFRYSFALVWKLGYGVGDASGAGMDFPSPRADSGRAALIHVVSNLRLPFVEGFFHPNKYRMSRSGDEKSSIFRTVTTSWEDVTQEWSQDTCTFMMLSLGLLSLFFFFKDFCRSYALEGKWG